MPTLVTNDRKLSYEEYGSGPVALLIHGSPGNAKSWSRVGEQLADRYHVVAPNLPGYGETTPQPIGMGDAPEVGYASELIEALIRHVGAPSVMAGHSYGGVVALSVALRGNVSLGALALFEPVALQILPVVGELEAYARAKAVFFDDYIASFEAGNDRAVQKMIDFWFGQGAFDQMPTSLTSYLLKETALNIKDVRATFRENYSPEAFQKLEMPITIIVGDRSPVITHQIAQAVAASVQAGSVIELEQANHALISTHAEAIARIIGAIAGQAA